MHFWIDKRSQGCSGAPPGRLRGPPLPPHRRHQAHGLFRTGRSAIPRRSLAKPSYRPRSRVNAPPGRNIPPLHHNAVLPPLDHPSATNTPLSRPTDSLPSVPLGHPNLYPELIALRNAECLHSQNVRLPPPHAFGEDLVADGSSNGGPPSPGAVGKLRCGMWAGFAMAILFVGGTKFYFDHQGSGVEVLVFCAMLLLFLLAGCIVSICRARGERQLAQQFSEACHHTRPVDNVHHTEPHHQIGRSNTGSVAAQQETATPVTVAESGAPREEGGPPPPYHIAILLPQPPRSLPPTPPPSYSKATT